MQWLQEYCFLHVGTFSDESKQIKFGGDKCSGCKSTIFFMLGHFVMHQIEFSFEVLYTMIAGLLFSTCWDLLWWIKMNLVWRWQMQWLQEYYFLHVGTLCDASKQIFFLSIVCSDCKMDGCDGSKRILFWSDQCNNCMCSVFYLME